MYEILRDTGKQLLTWAAPIFHYSENGKSIFAVKRRRNFSVTIIKSEDFLNKIARTFQYQIDECPMFYMKGVASTVLVNRVKSRTPDHSFYYCPTPDGFSGVVLAGELKTMFSQTNRYLYVAILRNLRERIMVEPCEIKI